MTVVETIQAELSEVFKRHTDILSGAVVIYAWKLPEEAVKGMPMCIVHENTTLGGNELLFLQDGALALSRRIGAIVRASITKGSNNVGTGKDTASGSESTPEGAKVHATPGEASGNSASEGAVNVTKNG